jgi:cytochrome P450
VSLRFSSSKRDLAPTKALHLRRRFLFSLEELLIPTAPGPRGHPLLGNLPAVRKDPLRHFLSSANEFGDLVRMRFGPMTAHLVRDPAMVKQVLQDKVEQYGKNTRGFAKIRLVLGDGLLTSAGSFWRRQRRIAQPAFHHKKLAAFGEVMARCASDMAGEWTKLAGTGTAIDVSREMMRLTLRIVSITLLSEDTSARADEVGTALTDLLHSANERMTRIFDPPMSIPTAANRQFKRNLKTLDSVVLGVIAERRKSKVPAPNDLLSMFMDIRDEETGEQMDDQQLRDEVMTVYIAGHETTANALTWTLMLLSKNPAEGRAVRAELNEVLGGRLPTFADLGKLVRTRAAIDESLRLYPPAWIIGRSVEKADELGGFPIPKGSIAFVSPYVSHRNPKMFDNPEGFDPQRFLDGRMEKLPRFAYFPFGGGPRICIGNGFAIAELVLVLATLWQKLDLELFPGHDCTAEPSITLRPKHGMQMTVRVV